jgi:hypothetical protein
MNFPLTNTLLLIMSISRAKALE